MQIIYGYDFWQGLPAIYIGYETSGYVKQYGYGGIGP